MAATPALVITVDGHTYTYARSDLCGIDAKDFRAAVGLRLVEVLDGGSSDLDALAGLIWLARRRLERNLTYEAVARALTYDSDVTVDTTVEPPPAADPET